MPNALPEKEILSRLSEGLSSWVYSDGRITREFLFSDFIDASAFLASVMIVTQEMDHHAEIWNVYNKVRLTLWSHDAGGVTERDLDLMARIDVRYSN
tara:strand:+ start:155 stop:445 length:291 start_codon:yes stop_codon:yes gene_type:complete